MFCEDMAHNPKFVHYLFTKDATNFQFNPLYWYTHIFSPAIPASSSRWHIGTVWEVWLNKGPVLISVKCVTDTQCNRQIHMCNTLAVTIHNPLSETSTVASYV